MIFPNKPLDGPIPGENYLSDTKNYPWHRPPDYTKPDDALDHIISVLKKPQSVFAVTQMLEIGLTVVEVSSILLMKGISKGKWTIDLALLIAGPLAHILVILAKRGDIEYDLGLDTPYSGPSKAYFKAATKDLNKKDNTLDKEDEEKIEEVKTNFLSSETSQKLEGKVE